MPRKAQTILALAFGTISGLPAWPQATELWIRRHREDGDTTSSANAMALDPRGHLYVVGESGAREFLDFLTVKYDLDGNLLWTARYSGPSGECDDACAVKLDSRGNVLVAGNSEDRGDERDVAVAKYGPDGEELWVVRFEGRGNFASLEDLEVDRDDNVLIAGYVARASGDPDAFAAKFAPDGSLLWTVGRGQARWNSLALDAAGNVHLAGQVGGIRGPGVLQAWDVLTARYGPDGQLQWQAVFDDGRNRTNKGRAVAVAPGAVYVAAESMLGDFHTDYLILRYDEKGIRRGIMAYRGRDNDIPEAIFVGTEGDVTVTGLSGGSTHFDYATVRFSPSGRQLWARRYDGPAGREDVPTGLAADSEGSVYVTGYSTVDSEGTREYVTIKYALSGEQRIARYLGPWGERNRARALVLDAEGNVYVTGESTGSDGGQDFVTIKYSFARRFIRADCNSDGAVNVSDAVFSLGALFLGEADAGCDDACDSNDDGKVDLSDAIATLGVLFLGQGDIPLPGRKECGVDPTDDQIGCDIFERCP